MPIDIDKSFYNTGTATISANGTTVTGQGTLWAQSLRPGDLFGTHVGAGVRIASVDGNAQLTLAHPWKGPAQTAAAYEVQFVPYDAGYQQAVRELLTMLASGNVSALSELMGEADKVPYFTGPGAMGLIDLASLGGGGGGSWDVLVGTLAGRDVYNGEDPAFRVLVANNGSGQAVIYEKTASGWSVPVPFTGPKGSDGQPNTLQIGSVSDGQTASATITGAAPNQELHLTLPKGGEGDPGPANTLTIGTVSGGEAASAEITGDAPNQALNLVLPKGDKGNTGGSGWTPVFAAVADAARYVQQVVDWTGGEGDKPPTGQYVGANGFVSNIANAVNIRGASGSGTGDMQAATYDPNNIAGDVFDRGKHTGTQGIDTVEGLESALNNSVKKDGDDGLGGYTSAGHNIGTIPASFTPVVGDGNFQYGNKTSSALTLNAPADGFYSLVVLVTNTGNVSSFSHAGFNLVLGDYALSNGSKNVLSILAMGTFKMLHVSGASA